MESTEGRELSSEEAELRDRHSKKIKPSDGVEDMEGVSQNCEMVPEIPEEGEVDQEYVRQYMSFRDTLMHGRRLRAGIESVDVEATTMLADKEPVTVSFKGDKPAIRFSENTMIRLTSSLRRCLILKVLGKNVGFRVLSDRLQRIWSISEDAYELVDLSEGYYMAKFEDAEDYRYALEEGPWMVMGHYLTVREWRPGFQPLVDKIESTTVWVELPGCPLEYYDEEALMNVGELLGRPIKVDENTVLKKRGSYAKLCVEVDLHKPLIPSIDLNSLEQEVRYEGLNFFF